MAHLFQIFRAAGCRAVRESKGEILNLIREANEFHLKYCVPGIPRVIWRRFAG
jgi:hypothetical protein